MNDTNSVTNTIVCNQLNENFLAYVVVLFFVNNRRLSGFYGIAKMMTLCENGLLIMFCLINWLTSFRDFFFICDCLVNILKATGTVRDCFLQIFDIYISLIGGDNGLK